jgi:hypothetical protein
MKDMAQAREGFKLLKKLDDDETVVAMVEYQERIMIATTKRVFRSDLSSDKLVQIMFEEKIKERH